MTSRTSSDDRRQRAWRTLERELGAPVGVTSDLGGIWGTAFDAYEGELAEDVENSRTIEHVAEAMHADDLRRGWVLRVPWPQETEEVRHAFRGSARAAIEAFLGVR